MYLIIKLCFKLFQNLSFEYGMFHNVNNALNKLFALDGGIKTFFTCYYLHNNLIFFSLDLWEQYLCAFHLSLLQLLDYGFYMRVGICINVTRTSLLNDSIVIN